MSCNYDTISNYNNVVNNFSPIKAPQLVQQVPEMFVVKTPALDINNYVLNENVYKQASLYRPYKSLGSIKNCRK